MNRLIPFYAMVALLVASVSASAGDRPERVVDCPQSIQVTVSIDAFEPSTSNASFKRLSGAVLELIMDRSGSQRQCVFTERKTDEVSPTASAHFLEIRDYPRTGKRLIAFEGYTPDSSKLYSVRTQSKTNTHLDGSYEAQLLEGSGAHRALADAELDLRVAE